MKQGAFQKHGARLIAVLSLLGTLSTLGATGYALLRERWKSQWLEGAWEGGYHWHSLTLRMTLLGDFEGTYTELDSEVPGRVRLHRTEAPGRWEGTWDEGGRRHGTLSVIANRDSGLLHGSCSVDSDCSRVPGVPTVEGFTLLRPGEWEIEHPRGELLFAY